MRRRGQPFEAPQRDPAESATETVALSLADDGASLWLAIEAAQFARILLHEEPETERQQQAMSDFVETFSRYTEVWEETASQTKAAFLATLTHHLATLKENGLHVHWASVDRTFSVSQGSDIAISLAVVSVGRTCAKTIQVMIPRDLEVDDDDDDEEEEDDD